jgi:ankyrin repeat protein
MWEVKRLLDAGADLNQRYVESGQTPLMAAAWFGHLLVIQYLMEKGADKDATDFNGYSVLHYALCYDQVEAAQYLLNQGVSIEMADNIHGYTALHFAAVFGRAKALMLLMSYGANLHTEDKNGRLPIDLAKTEEIKQAIRDEEARRDHRFKRIPAADLLPIPPAEASDVSDAKEEEEEEEEEEESSSDDEEGEEDEGF